ncbi:NAD(P)/FAD-dependent oxidoreductase [Patescibacteria group bacterium]|nr:NAD(P)/FAD-dependent oxidoreductase [Patescibacteria group bacterium]
MSKKAIIIGAGPAGLTAAFELLKRTDIKPVIFEATGDIGGISKTVKHKGNRIDIGGHRFFSKSDRVMNWWREILPMQGQPSRDDLILGRKIELSEVVGAPNPEVDDAVMLVRNRLSRIYFLRSFFDYPISLKYSTFKNLGLWRIIKIGFSYVKARLLPIRTEKSLEDFFVNRFGRELYLTFFKDYTEKVWGVPCDQIKPDWGAQRVKGLSITKAVWHALSGIFKKNKSLEQKQVETSLIEQFMYPKLGPGQLWEEVAKKVVAADGEINMNCRVTGLEWSGNRVTAVVVADAAGERVVEADYVFSTMPVSELIAGFKPAAPEAVQQIAAGLVYRDFITVGLLLKKMSIKNSTGIPSINDIVPDNWIYIQERDVKLGRLQIFNNWSPYLVHDPDTVWIGLEYFCQEGDELWNKSAEEFASFAAAELAHIGVIDQADVLDSTVIKMPKTYPAYFGTYDQFDEVRDFTDQIENLFLIGRNGMHRYNNADHSMLTAMVAVDNIAAGQADKTNIWNINVEEEYHEKK